MTHRQQQTPPSQAASLIWQGQSRSPEQTRALGQAIARHATAGDVLALVGELGAGKTQMVRGLAAGLSIPPQAISSPTFVLMHEYEPADPGLVLVHIDAYRLTGPGELDSIGWDLSTAGRDLREDAVVVVEWANRIEPALPSDLLTVQLEHASDTLRDVTLIAKGHWQARLQTLARELDSMFKEP